MQPSQMHDCIFFCTMNIHRQNHPITNKEHRLSQTRHRLAQYCINPPKSVKIRGKTNPQRDLKGRMPERSEWLLAGLSPSAFNLSGWIPTTQITTANNRITTKIVSPL